MRNGFVLGLLIYLAVFVLACSVGGDAPVAKVNSLSSGGLSVSTAPYNKDVDVDLSQVSAINSASLTISNQGSTTVVLPSAFVKGNGALNRPSILSLIQSAPLSDEQFALAAWQFVVKHNFHYCSSGAAGDASSFAEDPLRLLDGYAFGCCDQSSFVLAWLWQGAGYQTHIAQMSFHVVPEIYYKGAWHMYDPDHMVFYLAEDNQTVASVATVIADPSLVARTEDSNGKDPAGFSAQMMAGLYASATPYYYVKDFSGTPAYGLEPGQSYTVQSTNLTNEIFHSTSDPLWLTSQNVNSGEFDWDLDFSNPNWNKLPISQSEVTTISSGQDVFLTNSTNRAGYAVYYLSSPFPVFSLQVSGIVYLQDNSGNVNVYFSKDGSSWSEGVPLYSAPGVPTQTAADLTTVASGQYSYFIKVEVSDTAAKGARVAGMHIKSQVQTSRVFFPALVPGTVNHLTYQDWTPGNPKRSVSVSLAVH